VPEAAQEDNMAKTFEALDLNDEPLPDCGWDSCAELPDHGFDDWMWEWTNDPSTPPPNVTRQ
jgi:hypothetical protein